MNRPLVMFAAIIAGLFASNSAHGQGAGRNAFGNFGAANFGNFGNFGNIGFTGFGGNQFRQPIPVISFPTAPTNDALNPSSITMVPSAAKGTYLGGVAQSTPQSVGAGAGGLCPHIVGGVIIHYHVGCLGGSILPGSCAGVVGGALGTNNLGTSNVNLGVGGGGGNIGQFGQFGQIGQIGQVGVAGNFGVGGKFGQAGMLNFGNLGAVGGVGGQFGSRYGY